MFSDVLEVLGTGLGTTLQDRGRIGWRRFGVPSGGPMDDHAASWANRLLENALDAPVLELLFQGARFRVLEDCWVAVTGADAGSNVPRWRAVRVRKDDSIEFPQNRSGVWTYMAVDGGFNSERWLGSVSGYPRGQLGTICQAGDVLHRSRTRVFQLPAGVASRWLDVSERRNYQTPPSLRVWPGPQWSQFREDVRTAFFTSTWTVSVRSDRVGYRLQGQNLSWRVGEILSEPVRVGTIQVPADGEPIVTLRDGPTVGGYPKLGLIHPEDLSWLVQCRPGEKVRFSLFA